MDISEQIHQLTTRREDYVLLQRFKMPTKHGSRDAIAVTVEASKILLSLYTLMVSVIAIHLWYIFVLIAIARVYKREKLTRNHGVINVTIWNSQASPLSIIKSMFGYRWQTPKYAFFWAAAAFAAWAGSSAMSLLVSPLLIIGTAAPARLESIYVPTVPDTEQNSPFLRWSSLHVPAYLRAIEVLEATDPRTGGAANTSRYDVTVQNPINWNDSLNNTMLQVDYSYNITGVDFGLQHLPHLTLEVRGSCRTEYSWFQSDISGRDNDTGIATDYYEFFNDTWSVSTTDGRSPMTFAIADKTSTGSNRSFAFLTSSLLRRSYTQGFDPWYLTKSGGMDEEGALYQVVVGARPALSCWEESLMSNDGGPKKSFLELDQLGVLPTGLLDIFQDALENPAIVSLAQALGSSALKSAQTSVGIYFDAATARLQDDLARLVLGAFFATRNTLVETTLFDNRYEKADIPNLAFDPATKQYKDGVADFVIYGNGFAALSVKFLIIIPVITVFLFVSVSLLTDNPFKPLPWAYVNALKAPVLYSTLDNETFKADSGDKWQRRSATPHYTEKEQLAAVRPKYEGRAFSWESSDREYVFESNSSYDTLSQLTQ